MVQSISHRCKAYGLGFDFSFDLSNLSLCFGAQLRRHQVCEVFDSVSICFRNVVESLKFRASLFVLHE